MARKEKGKAFSTRRGEHVANGLRNHGRVLVDDEFEALRADQFHGVFLPHLLLLLLRRTQTSPRSGHRSRLLFNVIIIIVDFLVFSVK